MKGFQSGTVHLGDTVGTSVHITLRDVQVGTWESGREGGVSGRDEGLLLIRDILYLVASTAPVGKSSGVREDKIKRSRRVSFSNNLKLMNY